MLSGDAPCDGRHCCRGFLRLKVETVAVAPDRRAEIAASCWCQRAVSLDIGQKVGESLPKGLEKTLIERRQVLGTGHSGTSIGNGLGLGKTGADIEVVSGRGITINGAHKRAWVLPNGELFAN